MTTEQATTTQATLSTPLPLVTESKELENAVKSLITTLSKDKLHNIVEIDRLKRDLAFLELYIRMVEVARTQSFKKLAVDKLQDIYSAIEQYLKILISKHYSPTTPTPITTTGKTSSV